MDVIAYLLGHKAARGSVLIGITAQPEDATVTVGARASFTVAALGANLAYQWQYSSDDGETWANSGVASAVTATIKVTPNSMSLNGYKYRCVITSDGGTITSNAVTLTVTA